MQLLKVFAVLAAVVGLAIIWFKPIPTCLARLFGLCTLPNPILIFTLGMNPNFIVGAISIGLGIFAWLASGKLHGGRKGISGIHQLERVIGALLLLAAILDAILPFVGIFLLSGIAIGPVAGVTIVLQRWQFAIILGVLGAGLIVFSMSKHTGGRK